MIDLDSFTSFIHMNFIPDQLFVDRFKEDVLYVYIDCLEGPEELALRATNEEIEFSTISKLSELDFSLYDFSLNDQKEAEALVKRLRDTRTFFQP